MPAPATVPTTDEASRFFYDEWGDWIGYAVPPDHVKLAKDETSYRDATDEEREARTRCYDCRFYQWGACHLVEGTIEADDVCSLFKPGVQTTPDRVQSLYSATGTEGAYALFQPFAYAAEGEADEASPVPPEWFDYYPAPGRFFHDLYGEIVITPEGNREMVDNFTAAVFQDRIPIDCEHDLESSGAVGWITEMRVGDRGQVEARAEWNERGAALLTGDRFRYFSPHLWTSWKEPVNQTEYQNVAIGGAICVRPFFNQNHLTPLVATADGGLDVVTRAQERPVAATAGTAPAGRSVSVITLTPVTTRQREEEVPVMGNQPGEVGTTPANVTTAAPAKPESAQFSQADVQAFQQFMAEGGPAAFKALQAKAEKQEETITALRTDARRERFTSMVRGESGPDEGAPWVGAVDHNVLMLEHLADTSGEDSDLFAAHLETMRAGAKEARSSVTFSEIGSSKRPALGQTAVERRDQMVQGFIAGGMTEADALNKLATEHRAVYEAAVEELSERV